MADKDSTVVIHSRILKEGWVKRRSGRMHQWANRYFMLHETGLTYKLKADSTNIRGTFDFVPGTIVTDIIEESLVKMKSSKLYSFWVVNPSGQNEKGVPSDDKNYESDEDDEKEVDTRTATVTATSTADAAVTTNNTAATTTGTGSTNRNLQSIVKNELKTQKRQKSSAEEQVELHQAHDSNVTQGAMVAAVAVGGVVVGAMTMGIGLIPYFAVVGITAAATGGAVAFNRSRRPGNSRMIMAFETNKEAAEWKAAIEGRIRHVAESRRPMLPDSVNAQTISAILDLGSCTDSVWKRVAVYEGVCVLEHITFERKGSSSYKYHPMMDLQDKSPFYTYVMTLIMDPEYMKMCVDTQNRLTSPVSCEGQHRATRVRKAQLSVCCSPVDTFLTIMSTERSCWPSKGGFKVVRELDDHADIVEVDIVTNCTRYGGKSANLRRKLCLSRFWQLDDDGVYLLTYSTMKDETVIPSLTMDDVNKRHSTPMYTEDNCDVQFDAVITIAPRNDVANSDADIPEAMVTCICQVGLGKGNWQKGEVTALMEGFLKDNLLELRENLWNNKFLIAREGPGIFVGPYLPPFDPTPAVERAESNDVWSIDSAGPTVKISSPPQSKSASKSVNPPPTASTSAAAGSVTGSKGHPPTAPPHTHSSGGKSSGVTTVQPGMEDDGELGAGSVRKKKMGFLQRMTSSKTAENGAASSNLSRTNSSTPMHLSTSTSPNTSIRKTASSTQASPAVATQRSVSPLGALMARNRPPPTTTAPQKGLAQTSLYQGSSSGNQSRRSSSDSNAESDTHPAFTYRSSPPSSPGKRAVSPSTGTTSTVAVSTGRKKQQNARTTSPPVKRRDKKTNAEANKLRNHISMTEYEIVRLNKSLKKRLGNLQALEKENQNHTLIEENQLLILDYNSEIQALHSQINQLTLRQQGFKNDYLQLTGDPFEPSKGTRGMMERWKGARMAHKEKDRWDPSLTGSTATAGNATHSGTHSGQLRPILRHAPSVSPDDRPIAPMPTHWSSSRQTWSGESETKMISLFNLTRLLQLLSVSLSVHRESEQDNGTASALVASEPFTATVSYKSNRQRTAAERALQETRTVNLALVLMVTLVLAITTAMANLIAI